MDDFHNPHVNGIWNALNSFIENIKCLYESFEYGENMLRSQKLDAQKELNAFNKLYQTKGEDGQTKVVIPKDKEKQHQHLERKVERSQESSRLLMRSYIVSMVSQFDAFISNLMRRLYDINPDKLNKSGHTMTFADLQGFASIEEAREYIIESKIENTLRDSHQEQFKELASTIGVERLNKFPNWPVFVEITQRRNLFVHANGVVSNQYLNICRNEGVDLKGVKKGNQLEVDRSYFLKAFDVFYEVAVKLSQMSLRVLLYKKDETCLVEVDQALNRSIYDLIYDEHYDVAIELCDFALNTQFKHGDLERINLLLNRAQAYKWKGNEEKCRQLLEIEDISAWRAELKCQMYALIGDIDKVCEMMISSGKNSDVLTSETYRNWPVFKSVRGENKFCETFKSIFSEEIEPKEENSAGEYGEKTDFSSPAIEVVETKSAR